jgi:hypothetical protein
MKGSIFAGLVGVLSGALVIDAAVISPRGPVPGVIQAPVWRRDQTRSVENDLARRAHLTKRQVSNTVSLNLDNANNKLLYFANST